MKMFMKRDSYIEGPEGVIVYFVLGKRRFHALGVGFHLPKVGWD